MGNLADAYNATLTPEGNISIWLDGTQQVYNLGDMAWMVAASALVMLMIPGLGYFYGGLLRRKSALSMIWMSVAVMAVVFFEWFFWGFSLAFSPTGSRFIGDLKHFGLINVDLQPSSGSSSIPQLLFCLYQGMFAAITPVIACGAFADRARLGPVLLFSFCWATIGMCACTDLCCCVQLADPSAQSTIQSPTRLGMWMLVGAM